MPIREKCRLVTNYVLILFVTINIDDAAWPSMGLARPLAELIRQC